jgi:LPXTG-motif cell wall-anchored protein
MAPAHTAGVLALVGALVVSTTAFAAEAPVGLGTVGSYSVIAGSTVTNTGPSTLSGDLGVHPGRAITGFPPGLQAGARHAGDAAARQAKSDLVVAYDDAAGRATTARVAGDLVGRRLTPGVYTSSGPLAVSGTVTLDGQGLTNPVFIFQVASTLITASASRIALIGGATACNVYWQVGSSVTLGTNSRFVGTLMALQSISVTTGTVVQGRALARNGAVTLQNNVFTNAGCTAPQPTTTATRTVTSRPTATVTATSTKSVPGPTSTVTSPGPTTTNRPTVRTTKTVTATQTVVIGNGNGATSTATAGQGTSTTSSGAALNTSGTSGSNLANTGSSGWLWPIGLGAVLLALLGGVLIVRGRPRSKHS